MFKHISLHEVDLTVLAEPVTGGWYHIFGDHQHEVMSAESNDLLCLSYVHTNYILIYVCIHIHTYTCTYVHTPYIKRQPLPSAGGHLFGAEKRLLVVGHRSGSNANNLAHSTAYRGGRGVAGQSLSEGEREGGRPHPHLRCRNAGAGDAARPHGGLARAVPAGPPRPAGGGQVGPPARHAPRGAEGHPEQQVSRVAPWLGGGSGGDRKYRSGGTGPWCLLRSWPHRATILPTPSPRCRCRSPKALKAGLVVFLSCHISNSKPKSIISSP